MNPEINFWAVIAASAVISYVFRATPFIFSKAIDRIPGNVDRLMAFFAFAVIGSLIGEVVFEPLFAAHATLPVTDVILRLTATAAAFLLALRVQAQLKCLLAAYALFVVLHLHFVQGVL